eukprot:CAMPEP_0197024712 /NCGR_PEP_ID=MMETSP1384-20130603/5214_1 /TAXON_ID=29189 /ORGANISM="Ammonia sp." /LENGTH=424 /DNA_ID=CAMNT_0042453141 /DNA_START=75 /DNA_END=1349 /DNA_ORIENTATION=+
MFKSASSYLWGSSSSSSAARKAENKAAIGHQSTASLPDLDALSFEEEEKEEKDIASHSVAQLTPYHNSSTHGMTDIIVLDKESNFKLCASSNISFLFATDKESKHEHVHLSRYPYYIASNRSARYLTKFEQEKDKQQLAINVNDLSDYLDSLNLSKDEKKGILTLCEWVKSERLSIKLCDDMWMADVVMAYFSSLSPTNPDLYACWKRWVTYRNDHVLANDNVNTQRVKQLFDSGIFSIGFDNQRRPVWFINTEFYDDSFGVDVFSKACVLWISSLLFDLKKNEYDLFALRRGVSVYVNLSHWSINMCSWNIIQAVKKALIAYPYWLVDIYIVNIPTFMYLLKQLASKVVVPHAMDKFKVLADQSEYFEKYAPKHKTPICAGGTLKVDATQWITDRGFLDYVDTHGSGKHVRSPSAPIPSAYTQ